MTDSFSSATTRQFAGTQRSRAWWLVYVPLIALLIFAVAPLLLAWFTAFKTDQQQLSNPYGLPLPPTLDNLREAWTVGRFSIYFKNSLIISIADVIGMVIISSLAGYAFARLSFPGQKLLLYGLLIGLTIPVAAIIIPLYLTMRDFHLLDTYGSVIVADIALAAPIFVFIMRAFFKDLPRELDDAARVDGANEFQIFWQVMLPLAKPGLMTAGVLIISLPVTILFLVFQRDFVKGLASGALKG